MDDRFNLIRTPKLLFGEGKSLEIPALIKDRGTKVLVITGSESYAKNKAILDLFDLLEQRKFDLRFEKIIREPEPADIDEIKQKYTRDQTDLVLAVGGGSVLDAGKAVSAMLKAEENVKDYLEGVGTKIPSGQKKFFIAVPTTAGTGSEATSNAVLSETGVNGYKKSLRHENYVPDLAVVDPQLTVGCPADITANSGMDAFTQLIESYLSTKANPFTDALALDGISHVKDCLERAVRDGHDIAARAGMAYAAYLSGITLSNAGLGLIHGFASAIGGFFYAPHGVVCGTLMGVVNRYNVNSLLSATENTIAHAKYAGLGNLLSGKINRKPQWYIEFAANYIE
ncbi:MAG TPA: iron-containing alcohol dehydrogenase, partial [Bacteroidales bacterium]|nr:iron-containing alcohol dehydrogenase [Bacteroidales bacterium]